MAFTINYEGDGGEELVDLALDLCVRGSYIVELDVLTHDRRTSERHDYRIVEREGEGNLLAVRYRPVDDNSEDVVPDRNVTIAVADIVGIKIY